MDIFMDVFLFRLEIFVILHARTSIFAEEESSKMRRVLFYACKDQNASTIAFFEDKTSIGGFACKDQHS